MMDFSEPRKGLIFHLSTKVMSAQSLGLVVLLHQTSLDISYQTILIKLDTRYNPSNLSMIEQYIYQAFDMTGSPLYTFNYSNEYILFLETGKLKQFLYIFEQLGKKHAPLLKIGIGHSAPLSKQYMSYQSAKIAVSSLFSNESLAIFDSLDLEILFGNVSEDIKKFFLEKTILELEEKELKLLKTYFSNNMSLKETCEQLYLHKNTLQYQLDKIGKLTGYNPRNFKEATVLYVGLKLMASEE